MQLLKTEKRAAFSLALVYAMRMMGLFMVLPVFTLYADQYQGVTPALMGLAIGVYGLTQGLLQVPFGMMSDKFGRKHLIVFGLLLFLAGSIVAALATSIYGIILGRALQGMGAIASVVMALAADLSRDEVRIRLMAVIGMSIGVAFMTSMALGPFLAVTFGLSGIFWINAGFSVLGILVVMWVTPTPVQSHFQRDAQLDLKALGLVLRDKELLKVNIGVLILHLSLSATFVVFPLILRDQLHVPVEQHWKTYLEVFVSSLFAMVPLIIVAEKHQKIKSMMMVGVGLLVLSALGMQFAASYIVMAFLMFLFFAGFNFLESVLPSLISKLSPAGNKGTAMGVYSSFQFFGAFLGGALGGWVMGAWGITQVYLLALVLFIVWFAVVSMMKNPKSLSSYSINFGEQNIENIDQYKDQLMSLDGVNDVSIFIEDKMAYLKIDKKVFDETQLYHIKPN